MRVLHVLGERGFSGGEDQLAFVLERLVREGVQGDLVLQPGAAFRETASRLGVPVHVVRMRNGFDPLAAWRIRRLVARLRPDLLHLADARAHKLGALATVLRRRPPTVVTRRMDYPLGRGPWSRWLHVRVPRAVVAVSDAVAREVRAVGGDPARVHVVHDGVDPERFAGCAVERAGARASLGLDPGDLVVLQAASLRPRKGQVHLLRAFATLARERPEARLLLAGEGSDRARLEAEVRALALEARVRLPGHVPARRALAAADVACVPSLKEGLSVFSLEAQAAGLPVVASAVGGLTESVEDGVTGRLVPPGDEAALAAALGDLLADPALRRRLGDAARVRVRERFTAARMAEATVGLYRRVAAGAA